MEKYNLSSESIDKISSELSNFLYECGIGSKAILRHRLTLEELLLRYQEFAGADTSVSVSTSKFLGHINVRISVECNAYDAISGTGNEQMMGSLLSGISSGLPAWRYRSGKNEIIFTFDRPRRIGRLAKMLIGIFAGVVLGLLSRFLLSPEVCSVIVNDYILPAANAYTGLLCVMAILLTFFVLPLAMYRMGDLSNFHSMSRNMLRNFLMAIAVIAAFTAAVIAVFVLLYPVSLNNSYSGHTGLKQIYDIFIGFIPGNVLSPFIEFSSMQILVIGAMFGAAFVSMGSKAQSLVNAFDGLNLVAVLTNNRLADFIPIYIGFTTYSIFAKDYSSLRAREILLLAAVLICIMVLFSVLYIFTVSSRLKIKPAKFVKKTLPVFLIDLSSASFGASFAPCFNCLAIDFGADGDLVGISMNVGGVIFKPIYSAMLSLSCIFAAIIYGVEISAVWIALAVILSVLFSLAMPNIPSGCSAIIPLLFGQLGLPNDAVLLIISVSAILQFPVAAVNNLCLQGEILLTAEKEGKIDLKKAAK